MLYNHPGADRRWNFEKQTHFSEECLDENNVFYFRITICIYIIVYNCIYIWLCQRFLQVGDTPR